MNSSISLTPVAGWKKFCNKAPNNHCSICGQRLNDKGYCKHDHYRGQDYYKKPADKNVAGKSH